MPITQAAIAAVAVDHLPDDPSSTRATYTDEQDPNGYRGADFRYRAGGEEDGDLVRVTLMPPTDGERVPRCRCRRLRGARRARQARSCSSIWAEVVPEEDPGYVAVLLHRAHEDVAVHVAGEDIEEDPRRRTCPWRWPRCRSSSRTTGCTCA